MENPKVKVIELTNNCGLARAIRRQLEDYSPDINVGPEFVYLGANFEHKFKIIPSFLVIDFQDCQQGIFIEVEN